MKKYIVGRIVQAIVCIIGVSIIVFALTRITGDPVLLMVPPEATEQDIQEMRTMLGLDQPIYVQYGKFISGAVRGDFGQSIRWSIPCLELFIERFPNTLQLGFSAMFVAVFFGIPAGILSAKYVGRWFDKFGKLFAIAGQATPVFWLGIMLMLVFAVWLRWLPTSGMGGFKNIIMPAVTLGWYFTAALTRMTRSAMLDVLDMEYIKMARIIGVSEFIVVWKQALKNAAIPILTMGAIQFVILLNGTVLTETVFNWPGVGRLVVDAVFTRDFPVVQMCLLISSSLFIFTNLIVDVLYAYIDPRIRYG